MTGTVLVYVQHLLGIGHLQRARHIAAALAAAGLEVRLVAGGERPAGLAAPLGVEIFDLAPVKARDAGFRDLVGPDGAPLDDALRARRRDALLGIFAATRPDAVLLEGFPFGRRAFRFELDPLVAAARSRTPRPLLLSSIRDILVAPQDEARRRDIVRRVNTEFDAVLVHGDPRLVTLKRSFPPAREIAGRLVYTGYVAAPDPPPETADGRGEVLVSAGGGAEGERLLRAALAARRGGCLADSRWRLVAGPNLPDAAFEGLARDVPAGVLVERSRADLAAMLAHCRLSISQAGYNTVLEILAARARAVLVPFAAARETEQLLRAEILAARGAAETLGPDRLSPEALAGAIGRALSRPPPALVVDLGGAARSARLIARMIASPRDVRELVSRQSEVIIPV
ncbi:MAG TPA: glycosyltransferase [Stellaceae bacterium]|nr:glycosyltransferase [Stellaceae bacterium]